MLKCLAIEFKGVKCYIQFIQRVIRYYVEYGVFIF